MEELILLLEEEPYQNIMIEIKILFGFVMELKKIEIIKLFKFLILF